MIYTKEKLSLDEGLKREWLISNGIGGFSSSTIIGANTRRYHGLLIAPLNPPANRYLCLSKIDEAVVVDNIEYPLYTNVCRNYISQGFKNQVSFEKQYVPKFEYNVQNIFAHNAYFDNNALNNTFRYLTKSRFRWFFPWGIELWDTLKMARQTIGKQPSYIRWCAENNYMTRHKIPRPRLTAEILYRYISGDYNFTESHTGLEDVLIETKILAHCFRQHKHMEKKLFSK